MNGHSSGNGRNALDEGEVSDQEPVRSVNPYLDAAKGEQPQEIIDFEMSLDPYRNMVPTISAVQAARSLRPGIEATGAGKSPFSIILSVVLIVLLVTPFIMALLFYLTRF